MAHATGEATRTKGRGIGVLGPLAAGLFFLAALLAIAPALGHGPERWAGIALLATLAIVALLTLPTLRRRAPAVAQADFEALVRALAEPAALVADDGAVEAANGAWRDLVGPHRRL